MSQSDVHYTLSLINHQSGHQLKLELVDLPFCFLFPGFFCSVANSGSSDNGMICGCASANSIHACATGPWLIRVGIAVTGVTPTDNRFVCKI